MFPGMKCACSTTVNVSHSECASSFAGKLYNAIRLWEAVSSSVNYIFFQFLHTALDFISYECVSPTVHGATTIRFLN